MSTPYPSRFRKLLVLLSVLLSVILCLPRTSPIEAQQIDTPLYLPLVLKNYSTLPPLRINAPFFEDQSIPFEQTAIAWFGKISPTTNYTDIRLGYNNNELYIYLAIFDRRLWYDVNPSSDTLTEWDAVTLLLDSANGTALSSSSWRFEAQLSADPSPAHRAVYRGTNTDWQRVSIPFQAKPGWRGNALNDDSESDRGWSMELTIPFRSLGLDGPPPQGTLWRLGIITHDRDSFYPSPTPIPPQSWPPDLKIDDPQSWGILHFGLLTYQSTAIRQGTVSIRRESENDLSVPDADVGGVSANQCPGDEYEIWNLWPNRNYGKSPDFNIQNQSDVADWPCFSRYYVSFPITMLPPNKKIISATLTLHQFGNAGGSEAKPSWIQGLMTYTPWQEETITWNLAPLAAENLGGSWVYPVQSFDWPGHPRTWDVSYAVAKAYEAGLPAVHLILYEADSAYHSGKFFVSSDTGDWNIEGRPRLDITWGE